MNARLDLHRLATTAFHDGDFDTAEQVFTRLTEAGSAAPARNPDEVHLLSRPYYFLGEIMLGRDRPLDALRLFQRCRALNPGHNMAAKRIREVMPPNEHGHHVFNLLLELMDICGPVVEIGATREKLEGQGSTEKIAALCQRRGLSFVSVDMDPDNVAQAARDLARYGPACRAVRARGEDYLAHANDEIAALYLDAFDIDHDGHSEKRRRAYADHLGVEIGDDACHHMHLDAAAAALRKLTPRCLVVVDDTWRTTDGFTGKGALAVPYLLARGFVVVLAECNAIALARGLEEKDAFAVESDRAVAFGDLRFTYNRDDPSGHLYDSRAAYEDAQSAFLHQVDDRLAPEWAVDIGANFGFTGMLMADCLPDAKLVLAEPNPVLQRYIRLNMHDNGRTDFDLHQAAIGDVPGSALFGINPRGSQDSRVRAAADDWPTVEVPVKTLPQLLPGLTPDQGVYIKIDTQGYEEYVLQGARPLLNGHRRWLIRMEFAPQWLISQGSDPFAFLTDIAKRYRVAELPLRHRFGADGLDDLLDRPLDPAEAPAFVRHVAALDRGDRGWVDLLLGPKS